MDGVYQIANRGLYRAPGGRAPRTGGRGAWPTACRLIRTSTF